MPSVNGTNGTRNDYVPTESDSLLGGPSNASSSHRFKRYMTVDIDRTYGDLILLLCFLVTGLLDSSAVNVWGAFVSMQTGNSIYLGLGVVTPSSSTRWIRSLVSIGAFCFGAFCFSRFHRAFGPKRRWVLIVSFATQLLMIVIAALVETFAPFEDSSIDWSIIIPLGIVAFQSSGQAVVSRALEFNSMTSVVLTSSYCDLFSDPGLFAGITRNAERNRKVAAVALLLLGAVCGGLWAKSEIGMAGAMWTAVVVKAGIVVGWLFWREEKDSDE